MPRGTEEAKKGSKRAQFVLQVVTFVIVFLSLFPQCQANKDSSSLEALESKSRPKRKSDRLTAYACENTVLNITCGHDRYLDVIRANYGRFSITICNDHGNTDWKVDCQAGRTLRAMQARCSNKNWCQVPVQSSIFGDPCPGTYKYIEVHYACRREPREFTSTTSRPLPHWFPAESPRPEDWPTINNNHLKGIENSTLVTEKPENALAVTTMDPEDYEDESTHDEENNNGEEDKTGIPGLDGDLGRVIKVKVPKVPYNFEAIQREQQEAKSHLPINLPSEDDSEELTDIEDNHQQQSSTTRRPPVRLQVMANFTQYCPPTRARDLLWNWTLSGDVAVLQCPPGSTGFAKWACQSAGKRPHDRRAEWNPHGPVLAECRSLWLGELDSKLRGGHISVANVSRILATNTDTQGGDNANGILYGGDLVLAARMLKHMAERMHYDLQRTVSLDARESMVTDLVQNVVRTASNLIAGANHRQQSWADLGRDELGRAATALLVGLEENAFLLADAVTSEKIIIKPTENILLSIRVMQSRNAHRQRFPSVENVETWSDSTNGDSIELAPEAILQNGDNGAIRVIFTAYNQLDKLLTPPVNKLFGSWSRDSPGFINSRIIAASLGRGRHIELPKPVKITFHHLNDVDPSLVRPECVYWDYVSNSWSGEGCHAVTSNVTHTECSCNHLTNFALLMSHVLDNNNKEGMDNNSLMPLSKASRTTVVEASGSMLTKHISTIVASVATLISVAVIVFFVVMAWRRFKVSSQCRSALENSGLPCFHKGKEMAGGDNKDKGNNKGNFYTVTPKLNGSGNGNTSGSANDNNEVVEAQQFFEHMINLQKNEHNSRVAQNNRSTMGTRRSSSLNLATGEQHEMIEECKPNNQQMALNNAKQQNEVIYPKRSNYARALSPYNHIYMEIDPAGGVAAADNETLNNGGPVYEPLTHSETYLMSTMSDMSEDYNYLTGLNYNSDVSRQSSSRETRPLIRHNNNEQRNLLHTISGVLHSQSVRIAPSAVANNNLRGCATLHPVRRNLAAPGSHTLTRLGHHPLQPGEVPLQVTTMNGNEFVRLNLGDAQLIDQGTATYIASTTSDLGQPTATAMTTAYLGRHQQQQQLAMLAAVNNQPVDLYQANNRQGQIHHQRVVSSVAAPMLPQPQFASEI